MQATVRGQRQGVGWFFKRAITSSLGAKVVMALTGVGLVGFLLAHLAGNLQMFAGDPGPMNEYAEALHAKPALIWVARLGLLSMAILHVVSGLRLAALNRAARPHAYQGRKWRQASLASRTMAVSGLVVLSFIVFHLLHFTGGVVLSEFKGLEDAAGREDVYGMVVNSFQIPWVALFYAVSMGLIGMHLGHGIWSATQTLGFWGKKRTPFLRSAGLGLAVVIALGFASIPLAVLAGIISLPTGTP